MRHWQEKSVRHSREFFLREKFTVFRRGHLVRWRNEETNQPTPEISPYALARHIYRIFPETESQGKEQDVIVKTMMMWCTFSRRAAGAWYSSWLELNGDVTRKKSSVLTVFRFTCFQTKWNTEHCKQELLPLLDVFVLDQDIVQSRRNMIKIREHIAWRKRNISY